MFYLLVHMFYLTISLWVVCQCVIPFNTNKLVDFLHILRMELWSSIMGNLLQKSM